MFSLYPQSKILKQPRVEDPDDIRLGAFVNIPTSSLLSDFIHQIKENDIVLWGYADDRGVDRNGGRTGASEGPDEIRRFLYAMTPGIDMNGRSSKIWDLGNLKSWSYSLNEAHEEARRIVGNVRRQGAKIITLGGGHDWAFSDFVDFPQHFESQNPQLLNLDAHLDMRPLGDDPENAEHSGTPYRRILMENSRRNTPCSLAVFGLQHHCNALSHLKWAHGQRCVTQFLEEMPENLSEQWDLLKSRAELSDKKILGLSIDLDVFDSAHAPGVSAPQAYGIHPRIALKLIDEMSSQIQHFGIYEYNPRYDLDFKTARLAAKLIHQLIYHWMLKA